MKKSIAVIAAVVIWLALSSSAVRAITAKDVIDKHIRALGGQQKLESLKTLTLYGTMIRGGASGRFTVVKKAPTFYAMRLAFPNFHVTRGCDGKDVWITGPFGFKRSTGKAILNDMEEARIEPMLGFEQRGGKYSYVGIEPVMGDSCYKLLVIQPSGDSSYAYFDVHSLLEIKTEARTDKGTVETYQDEFKDVGGYLLPHKIRVIAGDDRVLMTMDSIFVNTAVSDTLFVMPDSASIPSKMHPVPDSVLNQMKGK